MSRERLDLMVPWVCERLADEYRVYWTDEYRKNGARMELKNAHYLFVKMRVNLDCYPDDASLFAVVVHEGLHVAQVEGHHFVDTWALALPKKLRRAFARAWELANERDTVRVERVLAPLLYREFLLEHPLPVEGEEDV